MTAATSLTLPLSCLSPGHEAKPPVNVRIATEDASVAALARNIADRIASGRPALIEPLVVVEGAKPRGRERPYYVANGGRRLLALRRLAEAGTIPADLPLPVVLQPRSDGLEASTSAAVLSQPHHPVDQLEAFAMLWPDRPETERVALIAARFALSHRRVRQVLALGALAPAVRAAWRAGEIGAAEAKAFTVSEDHRSQEEVLAELRHLPAWQTSPSGIRSRLTRRRIPLTGEGAVPVGFVGLSRYRAAGGTVTGDLFTSQRFIADEALFLRLLAERRAEAERPLREAGWGFLFWSDQPEAQGWLSWRNVLAAERLTPVWTPEALAERERLATELAAIKASRGAPPEWRDLEPEGADEDEEAPRAAPLSEALDLDGMDEDEAPRADPLSEALDLDGMDDDGDDEPDDRTTLASRAAYLRDRIIQLDYMAEAEAVPRERRASLAVVLIMTETEGFALAHFAYVPPALDKGAEAAGPSGEEMDEAVPPAAPTDSRQPVATEEAALPRAALQSLSLIANRAAAATIAADPDLALSLLAAAWIARARHTHLAANGVPLIVTDRGLGLGPKADRIAALLDRGGGATDIGDDDRVPHFPALARRIAGLSQRDRLSLVAALAAGALDMSHDTLDARTSHAAQKHVTAEGTAALLACLPPQTFATNCRLILADAGEAEALFGDWPKEALVDAMRAMDGDDAARQAGRAKKADLVRLVAERVQATGWLPEGLRPAVGEPDTPHPAEPHEGEP